MSSDNSRTNPTSVASTAASAVHENSITETIIGAVYTIPAGRLKEGDCVDWATAVVPTATNSTDTLTVKVYLSPSSSSVASAKELFSTGAIDVADDDPLVARGEFVVRDDDASGGIYSIATGTSATAGAGDLAVVGAHTSIDILEADQYLVVTADWSVADAGNICARQYFRAGVIPAVAIA